MYDEHQPRTRAIPADMLERAKEECMDAKKRLMIEGEIVARSITYSNGGRQQITIELDDAHVSNRSLVVGTRVVVDAADDQEQRAADRSQVLESIADMLSNGWVPGVPMTTEKHEEAAAGPHGMRLDPGGDEDDADAQPCPSLADDRSVEALLRAMYDDTAWSIPIYPAVLDDEPQFRAIAMPMPERALGEQRSVAVYSETTAEDVDKQIESMKEWIAGRRGNPLVNWPHLTKAEPDADPWAKIGTSSDDAPADIMESVRRFCR